MSKPSLNEHRGEDESSTSDRDKQEQLVVVAENTLDFFTETATAAQKGLEGDEPSSANVFASINTLTHDEAVRAFLEIRDERKRNLLQLCREPAIARVVVQDEAGEKKTYFIARATPTGKIAGDAIAVSYRAPIGRLASLPVGADHEVRTPGGVLSLEVLERAELRPSLAGNVWDSIDSTLEGTDYGPVTVASFRVLLQDIEAEETAVDLLDRMLAKDRAARNVVEGRRRSVINKMALRDRPVLDQFQDEIYRLPLDSRLVILGPPGTGKTTTLIKRLGLKLDGKALEEEEVAAIGQTVAGSERHGQSWLMFTPTELLKQYVKEAFARENIAASDLRIRTWSDYRRELARNRLGVLRTSTGRGSFVLREGFAPLQLSTIDRQPAWFEDFRGWQEEVYWAELKQHAEKLAGNPDASVRDMGIRLTEIVEGGAGRRGVTAFMSMAGMAGDLRALISRLRGETDGVIRKALARELQRDRDLLNDLMTFIDTLSEVEEEPDELEGEDEEEVRPAQMGRGEAAFDAYTRAIRAQARAVVSRRNLGRRTRSAKIIEWLGGRSLGEAELREVGLNLMVQASARRFVSPVRSYIGRIPLRYRRFRRERQSDGQWYGPDGFGPTDLTPLEADVILLTILRAAGNMLQDRRVVQEIDDPRYAVLKTVRDLYVTQVAVDEATDFSPIQLACMAAMCDPAMNAFLACGDFNQRLTAWGSRSAEDLQWVHPDFDIRSINITYRHSRQLNELARRIVLLSTPDASAAQLPQSVDSTGVEPVLAKGLSELKAVVSWLADRITEIERLTEALPSIAVLVNGEDDVQPTAGALNEVLSTQNIRAVPCPGGQVMGQENDVRVFDVQHIKGLEFEAVFFLSIDLLAAQEPQLFDNYLYVGATRAATYLGLTTAGPVLPVKIAPLESHFTDRWS